MDTDTGVGEKNYSRELLYKLRLSPLAKEKPKELDAVDTILKPQRLRSAGRTPRRQPERLQTKLSQKQQWRGKPKHAVAHTAEKTEECLHKVSNPYKRRPATTEEEAILRQARSILNKLTPENFAKLAESFMGLPVNNEHLLRSVVDLIFQKAVDEPRFSEGYATLCSLMRAVEVPREENPEEKIKFQSLLLLKCQVKFEHPDWANFNYELWDQKVASATSDAERDRIHEERTVELEKSKQRTVGTVQLIGELYKQKMMNLHIMHLCLHKLLTNKRDEENLECLCKLLRTVGGLLDCAIDKAGTFGQCMDRVQEIIDEKAVSTRIVFLLQGIVELRQHEWTPRRKEEDPKTIEKIREEAAAEQAYQAKTERRRRNKHSRKNGRNQRQNQHPSSITSENYTSVTICSSKQDALQIERIERLDVTSIALKPQLAFNRPKALTKANSAEPKGSVRPSSSRNLTRQLSRPEAPKRGATGP